MVAGLSIQTGQSAVQHVMVEHVNELVPVPTLLQHTVGKDVKEMPRKRKPATTNHVQVGIFRTIVDKSVLLVTMNNLPKLFR